MFFFCSCHLNFDLHILNIWIFKYCLSIWISMTLLLSSFHKMLNFSRNLTVLLAVIIQAVIKVRYGLDCHIHQLQIRGQPVCHAVFCHTTTTQTGQWLANQLLADARECRLRADGRVGGCSDHTHQAWDRQSEELGCARMTSLDFIFYNTVS